MPSHYGSSFDNVYRLLKTNMEVGFPVSLRTVDSATLNKKYGEQDTCVYGITLFYCKDNTPARARILISRDLDPQLAEYILIHEFAHCVDVGKESHGKSFGEAYARAWSLYSGELV